MVTSIPEIDIPKPPDRDSKPAQYLRSIYAVRERSRIVLDKAKADKLHHFDVDISKFQDTADYVVAIIKVRKQPKSVERITDVLASVTLRQITAVSRPTVGGSILRLEADHESHNYYSLGLPLSTQQNGRGG